MSKKDIPITDSDWAKINKLFECNCSIDEAAQFIGVSHDTLEKRIKEKFNLLPSEYKKNKKEKGNATLLMKQYELAIDGDRAMLIWLGKQRLDQADKKEIKQDVTTGGDKLNGISPIQWIDEQSKGDKDK